MKKNVVPSQNLPEDTIVVTPRSAFDSQMVSEGPEVEEVVSQSDLIRLILLIL